MQKCADAAWSELASMPASDYHIPEMTPVESARGNGRPINTENIQQFGNGSLAKEFEEIFRQRS
jgi:hypothetical protein